MRLAEKYHALAHDVANEIPNEIKLHIEDNIRNAATRGKFKTFYVVPSKWSHADEAIKKFLIKEGFTFEFNSDYQGKSFKIKF